jgi:hypothetical protein
MRSIFLFCFALSLAAQAPRSVTLTWTDTQNPAGTTYSVYRATGSCSGTPVFSPVPLVSGVATKTYQDTTVTVGIYCYRVTATQNAIESGPSPTAGASVGPFPPTQVQATVQ